MPQRTMTSRRDRIEIKLREALSPTALEIEDFSARHAGHAGAPAGGESHFRILIESPCFQGLSQLEQHRLVYDTLAQELHNGLHALELKTRTNK